MVRVLAPYVFLLQSQEPPRETVPRQTAARDTAPREPAPREPAPRDTVQREATRGKGTCHESYEEVIPHRDHVLSQ